MLLKIVALFLVFMVVMASLQKFLRLGKPPRHKAIDRLRCPKCKRIRVSQSAAPCERKDCEYR
ncbi:MAG: Cytochrome C biogenesis protein [Rhodobacteraceae bacterium HLUCCA12]|nr:MAG: Cytochrome C biogenesis protein [Rhodobacteraceae bacterium HLUCCA12]